MHLHQKWKQVMCQLTCAGAGSDPRDELELELEVHNDLAHEKLSHVQLRLLLKAP